MRKLFIPLLLTQLLLTPFLVYAGLTPEELSFAQKCHDNVNAEKKQLSVETALDCVKKLTDDNGALLARLRKQSPEMDEAAVDILAFNNALIDLRNIVNKSEAGGMVAQLQRAWMVERFTWLLYRRHRRHEETAGRAGDGERDGDATGSRRS